MAQSGETQSEIGAEPEQEPILRDEQGVPRGRDRTLLETDKEVLTFDDQATILVIHVNHGHMPLQAMFQDAGERPPIRRWVL